MSYTRQQFVTMYTPVARQLTADVNIFPETLLTQAAVESQNGNSTLSTQYNNFFGVKASSGWTGKTVPAPDGGAYRVYDNFNDSAQDYINFLQTNSGYTYALQAPDYASQLEDIADVGYASNPKYWNILSQVMDQVAGYMANVPEIDNTSTTTEAEASMLPSEDELKKVVSWAEDNPLWTLGIVVVSLFLIDKYFTNGTKQETGTIIRPARI